jgi:hypothetical protein
MLNPSLTTWETEEEYLSNPVRQGYDPDGKESEFQIAPAKWIWLPSERTLPNTFVLFRKEFELDEIPKIARGWIAADSRYKLYLNGKYVQFGPAPSDPRHAEADPVDLADYLEIGKNVIAVHVLFFGQGDGTWVTGKPGLLFRLNLGKEVIASDETWVCCVDRSRKPGRHKRWFLRALQEEVQFSLSERSWTSKHRVEGPHWHKAMVLDADPEQTPIIGSYRSYNEDISMVSRSGSLRPRSIPMMTEEIFQAEQINAFEVTWRINPNDWFDFRVPDPFESIAPIALNYSELLTPGSYLVSYQLPHEMVGFPIVSMNCSSNVVVELMVQESLPENQVFLDTHFFSWSRFICSGGHQELETFDYECAKYIQLHIDIPIDGWALVPSVRFRKRFLMERHEQSCFANDLDTLLEASFRTLQNSAQDIVVDGMARERQQYAGDGATQLHAVRLGHRRYDVSKRFLRQFGHGQMKHGIWFDSWPAFDRYTRLGQRHIDATGWGPLVDHSIGFVMEHVHHWLQTGDRTPYEENESKIRRFEDYLFTITDLNGLLKVEDIGTEAVWIDHDAYQQQSHKKLALNLYHLQMKVMLGWIRGEEVILEWSYAAIMREFYDSKLGVLVNNPGEAQPRFCDRSIHHLLWLHANGYPLPENLDKTIEILTTTPASMGIGYPVNSIWRHWAWARMGRPDLILEELRTRWANMYSVVNNGTIQEMWDVTPGSTSMMSHCGVIPTIDMHTVFAGIGQDKNGKWFIDPQLGDLETLTTRTHTPFGDILLTALKNGETHRVTLYKPISLHLYFFDGSAWIDTFGEDKVTLDVQAYPKDQLIQNPIIR